MKSAVGRAPWQRPFDVDGSAPESDPDSPHEAGVLHGDAARELTRQAPRHVVSHRRRSRRHASLWKAEGLLGRVGDEPRRLRLLAGDLVRVKRAARRRAIQPANERSVRLGDPGGIPLLDRMFEAPRERLRGRAPAEVLRPLAGRCPDAAFLLLDVRHTERSSAAEPRLPDGTSEPHAAARGRNRASVPPGDPPLVPPRVRA